MIITIRPTEQVRHWRCEASLPRVMARLCQSHNLNMSNLETNPLPPAALPSHCHSLELSEVREGMGGARVLILVTKIFAV